MLCHCFSCNIKVICWLFDKPFVRYFSIIWLIWQGSRMKDWVMMGQNPLLHRLTTIGKDSEDYNKANEEENSKGSGGALIIHSNQSLLEIILFHLLPSNCLLLIQSTVRL